MLGGFMSELSLIALEMLEPYARSILRECTDGGELFERRWHVALKQARAVVAALDDYRAAQPHMQATGLRPEQDGDPKDPPRA